ncbi:MAG: hypothetical protein C4526_10335 [Nitrospiraceae bacterium]|nr:MAG: hypothetical protein C4526_10335 [Nitrospiraceae bacterium]
MIQKTIDLIVVLIIVLSTAGYAEQTEQTENKFIGTISEGIMSSTVANDGTWIIKGIELTLVEYPDNSFFVKYSDAKKYGLLVDPIKESRGTSIIATTITNDFRGEGWKVKLITSDKESKSVDIKTRKAMLKYDVILFEKLAQTNPAISPNESINKLETEANPPTTIEDIKKNGLGNRFFIKEIPLSSEMMAACFNLVNCVSRVNNSKSVDNVTLASRESVKELIKQAGMNPRLLGAMFDRFDAFNKPIYIIYQKEVPESQADITAPLGNGSIHEIYGSVRIGNYNFLNEGDKSDRLNFGIIESYGYVYLRGKGKVILPDGTEVKLGYK